MVWVGWENACCRRGGPYRVCEDVHVSKQLVEQPARSVDHAVGVLGRHLEAHAKAGGGKGGCEGLARSPPGTPQPIP
eukprot:358298-Chlamydomonas_euryale.AAC.2